MRSAAIQATALASASMTLGRYRFVRGAYALIAVAVLLAGYIAWRVARHRRRRAAFARQAAKEQLRDSPSSE